MNLLINFLSGLLVQWLSCQVFNLVVCKGVKSSNLCQAVGHETSDSSRALIG